MSRYHVILRAVCPEELSERMVARLLSEASRLLRHCSVGSHFHEQNHDKIFSACDIASTEDLSWVATLLEWAKQHNCEVTIRPLH